MTAPTRRGETRQQRGDETRAAIIAETVACILEEGFGAASAKHITERAGVSWGVIQYHFGDRDQLLMAVVDEGFAGLQRCLADVDVPNGPLRERVSRCRGIRVAGVQQSDVDGRAGDPGGHPGRPRQEAQPASRER